MWRRHIRRVPFSSLTQDDPPRLRTTGPRDNPLSKDWIARGVVQQVGMSFYAMLLGFCAVGMWVGGAVFGIQVSEAVAGVLGKALGTALTLFLFLIGCGLAFVATRLIKGVGRSFRIHK